MPESTNGTAESVNRVAVSKKAPAKGTGAAFYAEMQKTVAKKKTVTLVAEATDAKVTLSVKSLPTMSVSVITDACNSGCDTTYKPKGGVGGKDATAKATYEGEHAVKIGTAFFQIDTSEKE